MGKNCLIFFLLLAASQLQAQQNCTHPGQTPVSAIPICGNEPFVMNTPTYCGNTPVPVACPGGFSYTNINPNFFRMACYSSGTLGFTIVPDAATANYDWQLFDITNRNPYDIFTVPSTFVACNWSSEPGETGATDDGTELLVCSGSGLNSYSKMPDIVQGRTYLLMVCNQGGSSGTYQLTLTGGTASVTDAIDPKMDYARASCDGTKIVLRTNKKIVCNTIAANGSDFTVSNGVNIVAAVPGDCSSIFGSDSVILTLAQPLANGTYSLQISTGTDGNTLGDICNKFMATGESIPFVVTDLQQTTFQQAVASSCSPGSVELVFSNSIRCSSIAADGSNFIITGPQQVNVTGATGIRCNNNSVSEIIQVQLSVPILTAGAYQVTLINGSDGSPLLDECGVPLAPNSIVSFNVAGSVSASFTFNAIESCKGTTINFQHNGNNATNNWKWAIGSIGTSTLQNPVQSFPAAGQHTVQLIVTNGTCSDTSSQQITSSDKLTAAFDVQNIICPTDTLQLKNNSTGNIDNWQWNFGNGNQSNLPVPSSIRYVVNGAETVYNITLIAGNSQMNCGDTASKTVRVLNNCLIAVPTAFTPNGDGLNDHLSPLNALKADNLQFRVYNRMGQLVFETKDWTRKWDGRVNGVLQNTGVYAWMLSYTHHDTGEKIFLKGTTLLIR
ncbi:MAG: gliding motility-associated C-terminal domain-containing protein [Chitinophagaceae bacterium]|nr:gliding motility-associated C-terminal domain-containing protein [Chitinophagaceae bacterium]